MLDLTSETPTVLRLGVIGAHRIAEVLGRLVEMHMPGEPTHQTRSPGLIGAHYQPRTPAQLIERDAIASAPSSAVLIAWSIDTHPAGGELIVMPTTLPGYAQAIYRALHEGDRARGTQIWIETPPQASDEDEQAIAQALAERLSRATHT